MVKILFPDGWNKAAVLKTKKVKLLEISHELVSIVKELFVVRKKLLTNPKKVNIPKIKPVVICPELKVLLAVSSMDLNKVIKE